MEPEEDDQPVMWLKIEGIERKELSGRSIQEMVGLHNRSDHNENRIVSTTKYDDEEVSVDV